MLPYPKSCLVAVVEESPLRLMEWLAYHRALGFEEILLATASEFRDQYPIFNEIEQLSWVRILYVDFPVSRGFLPQAIRALRGDTKLGEMNWVLVVVIREFLSIRSGAGQLGDLLEKVGKADAISLSARNFGSSGIRDSFPDLLTHVLIKAQADDDGSQTRIMRCIFRPSSFNSLGKHRPNGPREDLAHQAVWLNGSGEKLPPPFGSIGWRAKGELLAYGLAQINRYELRSPEEFLLQELTGNAEATLTELIAEWKSWDLNHNEDQTAANRSEMTQTTLDEIYKLFPRIYEEEQKLIKTSLEDMLKVTELPVAKQFLDWLDEPGSVTIETPEPDITSATEPEAPKKTGFEQDLTAPPPLWFVDIYPGGEQTGFYEKLSHHALCYVERSLQVLFVSFDNLGPVNDKSIDRDPWGYKFFQEKEYSHLGIFAMRKDWYRDREMIAALQRRADDGFFQRFGRVVITGTSMGGFAALAFSRLVPGATVIAFSPQTTLDVNLVPWETRFRMGKVQDWTLPFGDGSQELDRAKDVYLFYDPYMELDRFHVNRINGPNVTKLKTWYSSHFPPVLLRRLDLLKIIMTEAGEGNLTEKEFYSLYRKRKEIPWYMRALAQQAQDRGHLELEKRIKPAFRLMRRKAAEAKL